VTAFLLALGAVALAAVGHVKKDAKAFLGATALTAIVFIFELASFADFASKFGFLTTNSSVSYGAGFAFIIITWLVSMPTLFFCFKASKNVGAALPPPTAQPQIPMANAEAVKAEPVAQGVATV